MNIDREIGLFNCSIEPEEVEPQAFIVVSREERKVNLCLFVLTENQCHSLEESESSVDTSK